MSSTPPPQPLFHLEIHPRVSSDAAHPLIVFHFKKNLASVYTGTTVVSVERQLRRASEENDKPVWRFRSSAVQTSGARGGGVKNGAIIMAFPLQKKKREGGTAPESSSPWAITYKQPRTHKVRGRRGVMGWGVRNWPTCERDNRPIWNSFHLKSGPRTIGPFTRLRCCRCHLWRPDTDRGNISRGSAPNTLADIPAPRRCVALLTEQFDPTSYLRGLLTTSGALFFPPQKKKYFSRSFATT